MRLRDREGFLKDRLEAQIPGNELMTSTTTSDFTPYFVPFILSSSEKYFVYSGYRRSSLPSTDYIHHILVCHSV